MIGQKITINGVEWEEISYSEFVNINTNFGHFQLSNNTDVFYKEVEKVEQQLSKLGEKE